MGKSLFLLISAIALHFVKITNAAAPARTETTPQYEIRFFLVGKTFDQAISFCEDRNSRMVEVKDETITAAINAALDSWTNGYFFWIGANDKETNGIYKWNDGSDVEYSNWWTAGGEPGNYVNQNCVSVRRGNGKKWVTEGCSETRYVICQTDLNSVLFHNNIEYVFFRYTATGRQMLVDAETAVSNCQRRGSELVKIPSAEVDEALGKDLTDRTGKHHLTSGTDVEHEGIWKWGDGTAITYTNWLQSPTKEPQGGTRENCLAKHSGQSMKWIDVSCTHWNFYYICQREPCKPNPCLNDGTCSATSKYPNYRCDCTPAFRGKICESPKFHINGQCKYHIDPNNKISFSNANNKCNRLSGSLAIVKSENTMNFLTEKTTSLYAETGNMFLWIGGQKTDSKWMWVNGEKIPLTTDSGFSKWDAGKPTTHKCMTMKTQKSSMSQWVDKSCGENQGYICEVPTSPPCSTIRCVNGRCLSTGCQGRCQCDAGYGGQRCEQDLLKLTVEPVTAVQGENVILKVHVLTLDEPITLEVYKSSESNPPIVKRANVKNGTSTFNVGPVTLSDHTSDFSVTYIIKGYPLSETYHDRVELSVDVQVPVHDIKISKDDPVIPGTVWIGCSASGNPPPTITWFRNGTRVPTWYTASVYQRGEYLNVNNAIDSDAGDYVCQANNSFGLMKKEKMIKKSVVTLRVKISFVNSNPPIGNINFASKAEINCTFKGFPRPQIHWRWKRGSKTSDVIPNELGSLFRVQPTTITDEHKHHVTSQLIIHLPRCMGPVDVQCFANNSFEESESQEFGINKRVVLYTDTYFTYSHGYSRRNDTNAHCKNIGGFPATIHDQETQDFLGENTAFWGVYQYAHIGGRRKIENGNRLWVWPNGSMFYDETKNNRWDQSKSRVIDGKYVGWSSGQPESDSGKDCLFMDGKDNSLWRSESCSENRVYICEAKAVGRIEEFRVTTEKCSANLTVSFKPHPSAVGITHRITFTPVNATQGYGVVQIENVEKVPMDDKIQKVYTSKLAEFTEYDITITVSPNYCIHQFPSSKRFTTGIGLLRAVTNAKTSQNKNEKTCTISWSLPDKTSEGAIEGYEIKVSYEHVYSANLSVPTAERLEAKQSPYSFPTLPNRNYSFEISASNCAGRGHKVQARGSCISSSEAPKEVPKAGISKGASDEKTRDITLHLPSEQNGEISCLFVILTRKGDAKKSYTLEDLREAETAALHEHPDAAEYISLAISRSQFTGTTLKTKLGNDENTTCDAAAKILSKRRKREIGEQEYRGRNWPLEKDSTYHYFTVAAAPTEDGTQLATSPSAEFATSLATSSGNSYWIIGLIAGILVLICGVLLVLWLMRKRKSEKEDRQVVEAHFEATAPRQDQANGEECPYVNLGLENRPVSETEIALEDLLRVFQEMKANNGKLFNEEFAKLAAAQSGDASLTTEAASAPRPKKKNRYKNILSYDQTRVHLRGTGKDGYINACYVDGHHQQKKFIATQGPLPQTIEDFWMMISEQEVNVIAMLTKTIEAGKKKCEQYWPNIGESKAYGRFRVSNSEEVHYCGFLWRTLVLEQDGKEPQTVLQYHFMHWPDHGIPITTSNFFRFYKVVMKRQSLGNPRAPIVVHCSAGVGRTGAFIGYDLLLEQSESRSRIDVFECVRNMRRQRMDMVQKVEQYILIHKLIMESYLFGDTDCTTEEIDAKHQQSLRGKGVDKLAEEFNKLRLSEPVNTTKIGQTRSQMRMNRNQDIVPYDKTKVMFVKFPGDMEEVYINASIVESYDSAIPMIAAQGPMPHTTENFWRAIFDNDVNTIVMLTELTEHSKEQCAQYWPSGLGAKETYGKLTVLLELENADDDFVERNMVVSKGTQQKSVAQYQYTGWKSSQCPNDAVTVLGLIKKLVSNVQRGENAYGLIHCSDGGGRTGAFCAIFNVVERLKCENRVDVFRAVKDLRDCRPGMVQSLDQYRFIHRAVRDYLSSFDLYSNYAS